MIVNQHLSKMLVQEAGATRLKLHQYKNTLFKKVGGEYGEFAEKVLQMSETVNQLAIDTMKATDWSAVEINSAWGEIVKGKTGERAFINAIEKVGRAGLEKR